jgi:hypothetical protein
MPDAAPAGILIIKLVDPIILNVPPPTLSPASKKLLLLLKSINT